MQRLRAGRRDERGAVVVFLAGFSIAMVGMAALVVDVGSLLDEKRQLQNGADAAALAVAQSCALGSCNSTLATKLADDNSRDQRSDAVVGAVIGKQVSVTTSTSAGGSTILPYSFAQILTGVKGRTVHASATGAWDSIGAATAVPLAISPCDKSQLSIGVATVINLGAGFAPCPGRDTSGAFGWLAQSCQAPMVVDTIANGSPGKSGPKDCLTSLQGTVVLVPIYDTVTGTGSGARYHITGFAALRLTGWIFPSDASTPRPACGSTPCIAGTFLNYVTNTTTGGGADFGVSRVFLLK